VKKLLIILLLSLSVISNSYSATEFVCTVNKTGEDYNTIATWETAIQSDLTSAATKVFSHSAITGTIADGSTVTGTTSLATGTVTHATATQIMIKNITGTFQSGEIIYQTVGVNFTTINDAGDSVIAVLETYDDDGALSENTIDINGWTTSSTNYINIRAPSGERHNGTLRAGTAGLGFRLTCTVGNTYCIKSSVNNARFSWAQVYMDETNDFGQLALAGFSQIDHNIVAGNNTHLSSGVSQENFSSSLIYNNIIYDFKAVAGNSHCIRTDNVSVSIFNNTMYNCEDGLHPIGHGGTSVTAKNNLSYGNTGLDYYTAGGGYTTTSKNISEDTSSPDTSYRSKTITFANAAGRDFHLASTDTDAIDAGDDLSATFTDDIDGVTRIVPWDIGADEYVATSTTTMMDFI
jgi:hypothetical protein